MLCLFYLVSYNSFLPVTSNYITSVHRLTFNKLFLFIQMQQLTCILFCSFWGFKRFNGKSDDSRRLAIMSLRSKRLRKPRYVMRKSRLITTDRSARAHVHTKLVVSISVAPEKHDFVKTKRHRRPQTTLGGCQVRSNDVDLTTLRFHRFYK